jgi:signal transduction histidine kinase
MIVLLADYQSTPGKTMNSLNRLSFLRKRIGWLLLLVALIAIVVGNVYSAKGKKVARSSMYLNFDFKKISGFIGDSAHYFKAIDSIFSLLPQNQGLYENYACKRGYFIFIKRDPQKALTYTDSILHVLEKMKDEAGYMFWYSTALSYKADDLRAIGRYNEALGFYYLAREATQKTGDSCLYGTYSATLGMVAYQQKNYADAALYFEQAFQHPSYCSDEESGNTAHMQFANKQSYLDNIGLCYSKEGKSDSALFYFDSALNYIDQHSHAAFTFDKDYNRVPDTILIEKARGVIFGNMAVDLIKTGREEEAERLLRQSIQINSRPLHALEDVPYSQAKLAGLYLKQKRNNEAGQVIASLKAGIDTFPNTEILKRWHFMQSQFLESKGDFAGANIHLNRYLVMKDSLETDSRKLTSSDIRKEFDHLKTQYQLHSLQKEDALRSKYMWVAFAGASLSIIIGLLIWRNYRQSTKHIDALEALNRQIRRKNLHLQNTLSSLEKSHEDNSRMMKIVAHDLRNPIGGIAGLSAIMLKENGLPAAQRGMLEMIHKSSNHSIELIQDLVHINTSAMERYKEPVELRDLLSYCIEMLHLKSEEKNQRISLSGSSAMVQGDREKLWRVFNNLISNAIKFSASHTHIRVSLANKAGVVTVSVHDQGIGIPVELKDKIFHMSGEAKRRGTAGEPSFGLGLGISKQIVESNNGKIWFESGQVAGTTFYVSFPAA